MADPTPRQLAYLASLVEKSGMTQDEWRESIGLTVCGGKDSVSPPMVSAEPFAHDRAIRNEIKLRQSLKRGTRLQLIDRLMHS